MCDAYKFSRSRHRFSARQKAALCEHLLNGNNPELTASCSMRTAIRLLR